MPSQASIVGKKLVELCSQGKNLEAVNTLYADNIVSTEASEPPTGARTTKGIAKIREKGEWWVKNHDIHREEVKGPFPHGDDRFAVVYDFEVTPKVGPSAGKRIEMEEVAVYTVRDGKIAAEEFYYAM